VRTAKWSAMSSRKNLASSKLGPLDKKLDVLAARFLTALKVKSARLDIIVLPDKDITALKAKFIKKRTEPNVLAFREPLRFPHPESKKRYLGEVYLNRDILKKSPERAEPLLLHGILHLLGYDHKRPADIKKMEGLEKRVLGN
jgi:probable rRNA maturation factor